MWLPPKWKVDSKSLKTEKWGWPVNWLFKLATFVHEHEHWYVPPASIVCFEEPPMPIARGVGFSSMLLITGEVPENMCERADGSRIALYNVMPIYESERQFEIEQGIDKLFALFDKKKTGMIVDIKRKPVV